ncbi:MAG TPA: glycogen synthase GlgA [Rhodospirillaceae bacterium]|nr:MAG: starch synthase [Alphaproteobacteria bacterium GWF2_58_20]HAU28574.1 glycogen synthase GlgA [Rhodospirillaceae bacterium]
MKILFIASEAYPLVKTGGLADVVGALPAALRQLGEDVRLLLPGYPEALGKVKTPGKPVRLGHWNGFELALVPAVMPDSGVPLYLLTCPALYERDGGPYQAPDGRDWPDNALRFGALCQTAVWMSDSGRALGWRPDILHAHDWQAGLVPALAHQLGKNRPPTVMTIHNMSFGGGFPMNLAPQLGLPPAMLGVDGAEFYGQLSFLKAGLFYADHITAVSPTYAQEITTKEGGEGFDGLMRARSGHLSGILNGVDYTVWNPATDSHLVARFSVRDLSLRASGKASLQAEMGLPQDVSIPLLGVVSRFAGQKGIDLILDALPDLLAAGAQLVVLGSGDPDLEARVRAAAAQHPAQVAARIGFDEGLSHRFQAGCDMILVPSRFEPCGLTQFYAMRCGALPVVRRVGGLADSVVDAADPDGVGFVFERPDAEGLLEALHRAFSAYKNPRLWAALQQRAMARDFSWSKSAVKYRDLYRRLPLSAMT